LQRNFIPNYQLSAVKTASHDACTYQASNSFDASPMRYNLAMHIGVLTHNYPRFVGDFSGTFVEALCEEFAAQGQRVTVWAPHDGAYARPLNAPVHLRLYRYAWPSSLEQLGYMRSMQGDLALRLNTYALSPALFATGIAKVIREARQMRPDVLHAHWVLPNGFIGAVASRLLGIPLVVSVPGSDAQVAGKNPLFRRMARFAFDQASLLTANSESLREAVVALGADPAKFDMIIYGTDPNALRPQCEGVAERRAELQIPDGATVLLCVGRMVYKKGFDPRAGFAAPQRAQRGCGDGGAGRPMGRMAETGRGIRRDCQSTLGGQCTQRSHCY
jgi:glycosyltransferase involved in cell wall biosynthesis